MKWEPPIAYTGAVTGSLLEAALYCDYRALLQAREQAEGRGSPGEARKLARRTLDVVSRRASRGYARPVIEAVVMGIPVVVSPDAVLYRDSRPVAVVRARKRRDPRPRPRDWAYLYLAGLALEESQGVGDLVLVLVTATNDVALHNALSRLRAMEEPRPLASGEWRITTRVYDREEALRVVARPLRLLAGLEDPRPPSPAKCKKCILRDSCPYRP